jgi:uncharacterized protein YjbJ (UPF0337 family)
MSALTPERPSSGGFAIRKGITMNRDRIIGSAKQVKGNIEQVTGRIFGDAKLTAEGKIDESEGKLQNSIGSLKDSLKK